LLKLRAVLLGLFIFMISACTLSSLPADLTALTSGPAATTEVTVEPENSVSDAQVALQPAAPLSQPTSLPPDLIAEADAEELLLINLYERVNPSVVNIVVTVNEQDQEGTSLFPAQGQGSGFIVDTDGHILTNNHVVEEAQKMEVTFFDGTNVPATIVGQDPDSDLAVIKVNVDPASLRPIVWGNSDRILVGQRAVAIGNPFGLEGSLTTGIISALGRSLPTTSRFSIPEIIQTDAAINPGNSGGPLLNSQGEVIGVNSAIVPRLSGFGERSFLGVGFAIPANLAKRVATGLIDNGMYEHPWIGFSGNTVFPEIAKEMKLPAAKGALVSEVISGSPADDAHLRGSTRNFELENGQVVKIGGDVIIAVEDETVNVFDDLISFLSRRGEVGKSVTLTIIRNGEEQTIDIVLGARPVQEAIDLEGLE
jgi:S1-C subfamily serine protease